MNAQMLKVDLSKRSYEIATIPTKILKNFLGGRGLGAYLLYSSMEPKVDPLGPENHVIFTAGPANGTSLYFSSKVNVNTKSPLTNTYLYSISGGTLAHQMRKAGFWAIDITGIAESPTYIVIDNQKVNFVDAASLWGMETAEAQNAMLGSLSGKKAATAAIGPAGEKLIGYAAIFSEGPLYRSFNRGGAGCVMGSKKLKGLVIAGDGVVEIQDKERFEAAKREIVQRIKTDWKKWADGWRRYETAASNELMYKEGIMPTRNWTSGQFEGWESISKATTPMGWPEKTRGCGPFCPVGGTTYVEVKEGPDKGAHCDSPEWETIYAFGTNCGVDKMEAIIAASQICDEFGVDSMSTGLTIGFAMECFEQGFIGTKDTDGIELRFGNDQAMIDLLRKIVKQEGFGRELAKGVKKLSEKIKGSEAFAMHVKGLELGGYECRGLNGQALQFAVSPRGGCHHAFGLPAWGEVADGTRLRIQGKGGLVKREAISRTVHDSLIGCTFAAFEASEKEQVMGLPIVAEIISSVFGEEWSMDHLNRVGIRIMNLERQFNACEGFTRNEDTLPARLLKEPKADGPTKGSVVPLEELKDDFYRAMGWDLSSGNPTDSLLNDLEIHKK